MIDRTNTGKRIQLLYTDDQFTDLKPGDKGTVIWEREDSVFGDRTISVNWDNGSSLSLVEGDRFRFL